MSMLRVLSGAVAVSMLAGCSVLQTKQTSATTFVLHAPSPQPRAEALSADLAVGLPRVAPGLEGDQIRVLRGREIDYFAGARWGAELDRLVQSMLVRTITRQRGFNAVAADDVRIDSDYLLDVEVTDFQAEYADGAAPTVRVGLVGRLIRVEDRTQLESEAVEVTQTARRNRLSDVIEAFETAAQQASLELSGRIVDAAASVAMPSAQATQP